MIKVLHCADLHLGSKFTGLPKEKAAIRRKEQRRLLTAMLELSRTEECDLVIMSGDIFDRPEGDGDSILAMLQFCEQVEIPVFIAPGNHDFCVEQSPYLSRRWPENVHIFRRQAIEKVTLPKLNTAVWGAGFVGMDCPPLLKGFHATGEEYVHIMALHGDATQPNSPNCPVTREQVAESALDYLALGHIHRAGGFQAGDTFCAWPGCPMGRGYDETGRKGVIVAEVAPGYVKSRLVFLSDCLYEDIKVTVGENTAQEILKAFPDGADNTVCRITLEGDSPEPPLWELQRALEPHFFHLELVDRRKPLPNISLGKDTLEGTYFRLLRQSLEEANDEDREVLTLAGRISLAILEGREVELP